MQLTAEYIDDLLDQLEQQADNLDPLYESFGDYMFDFYPDLPWTTEESIPCLKLLLASPRLADINKKAIANHNFDVIAEFQQGLKESEAHTV